MLQVYYHVIWTLLGSRFPLLLTLPSIPFISASMHLLPELIFGDFTHLTLQLCATPPMIFFYFLVKPDLPPRIIYQPLSRVL